MSRENRKWLVCLTAALLVGLAGCGTEEAPGSDIEAASARQGLITSAKVPQAVAAGAYHSLFLTKDGEVWAWGQNVFGQLGTGSTSTNQPQPTRVSGLPAIKAVAAGIYHSLALDMNGDVWVWGQNGNGQAGLGAVGGTVLVPTRLATLSGIQSIAANGNFSLALGADGRLWAWGQNASGQVGVGFTSFAEPTPFEVPGLPTIRTMAAGVNHALALDADGKVWGWGLNTSAQVGTGVTSAAVLTPTQVAGVPRATALAAGAGHSLLVDEQFGNVWAWGQNTFGQVGTGSASSIVTAPRAVDGVFAVTTIAAGHNSSFAIIGNGFTKGWGHNAAGQLGNGTTANSASPVDVTGVTDATALAAGAQHVLTLRPGCPVWTWGNNGQGQLGTGSTSTTPVTAPATALILNTFYFDGDMDGFGDEYLSEQACAPSPGFVEELDCDDYTATTYPGAPEVCNGVDDSCDGVADDGNPSGGDTCATGKVGVCATGTTACTSGNVACQQNVAAGDEQCDLLDNDCDGETDEGNPGGLQQCETGQQGVCGEGVTYCTHGVINCVQKQAASSEVCDSKDNDCNGQSDDGLTFSVWYRDQDGDGYGLASQAVQACARPTGYSPAAGDCDDAHPGFHPSATEVCDGLDNDCDGQVDEGVSTQAWYRDADGDGFGDGSQAVQSCRQPSGYVANTVDCNDASAAIKPGASEVCDGLDNDCDTQVDEGTLGTWYRDADGDGYGNLNQSTQACSQPTGYVANAGDCNDGSASTWPGAFEVCDGADNNCNGSVDEGLKSYRDADGDGEGAPLQFVETCNPPAGYVSNPKDCDDSNPATHSNAIDILDGIDNNCDEFSDNGIDSRISSNYRTFILLKQSGTVWTWGNNQNGQAGDGTTINRTTPGQTQGLSNIKVIKSGHDHTLALKGDGTVWAWGDNLDGQVGPNASFYQTTAIRVQQLSDIKSIVATDHGSLALKRDGTVWGWGNHGTGTSISSPTRIQALSDIIGIVARGQFLALKRDGTVWGWGNNTYGQVGDGTTTRRTVPVQIQGLAGIIGLSAGPEHSLALKNDGTVWAWGRNSLGELGNGTTLDSLVPMQTQGLTGVKSVFFHDGASMALKHDGTMWSWGYNFAGQLGDGTTTNRYLPVQVQGVIGITMALFAPGRNTFTRKTDGTIWAWGRNEWGGLGDGTKSSRRTPVMIPSLAGTVAFGLGGLSYAAMKQDGTVWAWGYNDSGQLGDGTTTNRIVPAQIPGLEN
ncbi:RCC1 domain-containing protein [Corallococcus terminator]|uniref:RCC1-like domain-containing protein n=1 Tax=Corallococcus terminator TaxID=2316733 RepID=A0A3A8IDC6_9BACT|nr:MopE-related protein [Corallococcus terminator]RKG77780.1 hypothetical protein D7V88_30615 [Corallococcus terminator]